MLPTLPNLDGLVGLARQEGVDVRPTLLRVLTDLYLQKATHTPEEEHRFTELALWLLTGVDVPTRAAVARKLATYPRAPHLVIRRLARDVLQVAEPVLRLSSCLTADDLLAIIKDFGPRYAAAIAARNTDAPEAEAPAQRTDAIRRTAPPDAVAAAKAAAAKAAAAKAAAATDTAATTDAAATAAPTTAAAPVAAAATAATATAVTGSAKPATAGIKPEPVPLGDHFLNASPSERRLLLSNLDDGSLSRSEQTITEKSPEIVARLEAAALERQPDEVVREIERMGIPASRARKIVDDEFGEPMVVLAKALDMSPDVLVRILLLLNAAVGHSVERVFDLVRMYEQLSAAAALHVVSSWQSRPFAQPRKAAHQPLHWDDERRGARRIFSPPPVQQRPAIKERPLPRPLLVND
jgi:hypothetical protein